MAEKKIQINENDFEPVNRFIDEQSAIRRSRSFWGYAKSISLILIALGIMAILVAYAFYLYKKKDYLVSVDQVRQQAFSNGASSSQGQISQLKSKINNLEDEAKSNQSVISGLKNKNKSLETDYNNLQNDFTKSRDEVANLRTNMLENKEAKFYQKELEKIKQKASNEKTTLQTNLVLFLEKSATLPGGENVIVKTRWYFKDPRQDRPNLKNCYIDFVRNDIRALELGDKQSDFTYGKYYQDKLGLKKDIFVNIKNNKCDL